LQLNAGNSLFSLCNRIILGDRNHHIVDADGNGCLGRKLIAHVFQAVCENNRGLCPGMPVGEVNDLRQLFLAENLVDLFKRHTRWKERTHKNPAYGSINNFAIDADLDTCLQVRLPVMISNHRFIRRAEDFTFTFGVKALPGHVIETKDNILRRDDNRFSMGRRKDIVG